MPAVELDVVMEPDAVIELDVMELEVVMVLDVVVVLIPDPCMRPPSMTSPFLGCVRRTSAGEYIASVGPT